MRGMVRNIVWAFCAIVAAIAMMFVGSAPAMADNTAIGIADASGNTGAGTSQQATGDAAGDTGAATNGTQNGGASGADGSTTQNGTGSGNVDSGASDAGQSGSTDSSATGTDDGASTDAQSDDSAAATADADAQASAQFVADLKSACAAGQTERVITVTADIAITETGIVPQCDLVIVSDGNPHAITWSGSGSVLQPQNGRTVTIGKTDDATANNLTFTNNGNAKTNPSGATNPLFHSYGTVIINGGTFKDSASGRGAIVFNDGTLTINGGTFENNKATGGDGGGVVYQSSHTTIINGGTFANNVQDQGDCAADDPSGSKCRHDNEQAGGGAIHVDAGTLNITGGDVRFEGNHSKAWGWMNGGGAIYIKGTLWIKNGADGRAPQFIGNWSGVLDTQYTSDHKLPVGGAGGAIFVQNSGSTAYFMGGRFENNTSGYLGGAVYTEEDSTSYVGKTVAYKNIAGHFGGGLWLCPSGEGEASKGGNIAMFGNSVSKSIDANTDNDEPYHGDAYLPSWNHTPVSGTYDANNTDGTEAGADFAMMNPAWKNKGDRSFVLMDTWFTDRSESAVDWYQDGIPVREASGYEDGYQNPGAYASHGAKAGALAVTKTGGRYETDTPKKRIDMDADHTNTLVLTKNGTQNAYKTGVALTAIVKDNNQNGSVDDEEQSAKDASAVSFTNNAARLSGGAFGTNGTVKFSTPYTASWSKVKAGTTTPLSGSEWTLSTTGTGATAEAAAANADLGGPYNPDYFPGMCEVDKKGNLTDAGTAAWKAGRCWKTETTSETKDGVTTFTVTRSARVLDNTTASDVSTDSTKASGATYVGFDNNPEAGGFDLNNLHNGTYTLEETKAPSGYQQEMNTDGTAKTYTFKVNNAQAHWDKNGDGQVSGDETDTDISIGNKPLHDLAWTKRDSFLSSQIGGSTWTLTPKDGTATKITDCKADSADKCVAENGAAYHDSDPTAGGFLVTGLRNGAYTLKETAAPTGYWAPDTSVSYQVTVTDSGVTMSKVKDGKTTAMETNDIFNTRPGISWTKADASDTSKLLGGSEWTIRGPLKMENGKATEIRNVTKTATVTDCVSETGDTTDQACDKQVNKLDGDAPTYADVDRIEGQFTVLGLTAPTGEDAKDGVTYTYELTEKTAPKDYVKFGKTYTFTIAAGQADSKIVLCPANGSASKDGCIAGTNTLLNAKTVASLPLTGGLDARDWLLIGGVTAVAAALALALVNEYRKRKGLA
ncbi:Cna protein B-type domain protein [Bifidobacterium stellenboschense]|uniref:Cna protein B-type domain protein n=2 Tax=Bifidobacterium stellenboschense TaxID=762211 RepID=A0A087DN99_9BIFI|nr:Cna protein B-type domain protein [Bifidobacterium stellenboschense]